MLDDARDGQLGLEMAEDAVPDGGVDAWPATSRARVALGVRSMPGPDRTGAVELRKHGSGHSNIGAAVEELVDRAAEVAGPGYWDREVAHGRASSLSEDGVDDLLGVGDGVGVVVGVQVGEIADEVLVVETELGRERLDQVVVGMDAARQDEG
ncbi:MAG TPA: hypothetical protein VHO06_21950 [Polyangia bacterium]|nr:hypothetical protein [Polyangia bacterium]